VGDWPTRKKTLKRLSSLSFGERFRSGAFSASIPFNGSMILGGSVAAARFGRGWESVAVSSASPEIGERTAVVSWLFTSKPSRLVDLGSSCCFTSYGAFLRRRYFALRNIRLGPSNFLLLNFYIRAHCGASCKLQKSVQLKRHVAAAKEP
jgi:hypothetical protein